MRDAVIEAFIYYSARARQSKNIGVYVPDVFKQKKNQYIANQQNWLCIAKKDLIEFTRLTILNKERLVFSQDFY